MDKDALRIAAEVFVMVAPDSSVQEARELVTNKIIDYANLSKSSDPNVARKQMDDDGFESDASDEHLDAFADEPVPQQSKPPVTDEAWIDHQHCRERLFQRLAYEDISDASSKGMGKGGAAPGEAGDPNPVDAEEPDVMPSVGEAFVEAPPDAPAAPKRTTQSLIDEALTMGGVDLTKKIIYADINKCWKAVFTYARFAKGKADIAEFNDIVEPLLLSVRVDEKVLKPTTISRVWKVRRLGAVATKLMLSAFHVWQMAYARRRHMNRFINS